MNDNHFPEVIVSGLNVVDVLVQLPGQVSPGQKHEVNELTVQGGAPAPNAACVCAMLGHETAYLGRMGKGVISTIAKSEFARYGVSDALFIEDAGAEPAVAVVEIDPETAERTVYYSLKQYRHLALEDVPRELVSRARMVLVDGYEMEANLELLRVANAHGVPSLLDIEAGDPALLNEMLALGTYCILPLVAGQMLAGKKEPERILSVLAERTAGELVLTDGLNGSWSLSSGRCLHQEAFRVDAVDTTGCGDAYHGAYAAGVLKGMPRRVRMEFAAWVAARVALAMGGRESIPDIRKVASMDISMLSDELKSFLQ